MTSSAEGSNLHLYTAVESSLQGLLHILQLYPLLKMFNKKCSVFIEERVAEFVRAPCPSRCKNAFDLAINKMLPDVAVST